ncbi:MAG: glucose 1-dehydrogenase [Bacteroidetes bacterium]|nr:glucose 1-dehydrogenase [Bacteroidota bacterium]
MFSLKGKTAVITGGGSGIGRGIARVFAAQGADVKILELNQDAGLSVCKEIIEAGGLASIHGCDVSKQAEVVLLFNSIGKVDILVNNAGIAHVGRADTTSEADMDRIYNVNVKGAYNCLFAAIPLMKKNGGGVILNLASIVAIVGVADRFAYSMSKGAIYAMTLSVAKDYLADNIRCNSISPARVHTPFVDGFIAKNYPGQEKEMFEKLSKTQPVGRMATPEDIAVIALYLCADESSFVTGNDYPIDGGFIKLNS